MQTFKQFNFVMPKKMIAQLKQAADLEQQTASEFLRRAVVDRIRRVQRRAAAEKAA